MYAEVSSTHANYESTLQANTGNVVFVLFQTVEQSTTPIRLFLPFAGSFSIEAARGEFLKWLARQYTEQLANLVEWKDILPQDLNSGQLMNRSKIAKSTTLEQLFQSPKDANPSKLPPVLVIMTFTWPDGKHPPFLCPQRIPNFGSADCSKELRRILPRIARNVLTAIDSSIGPLSQSEFPNYSKRPSKIMHLDISKFMLKTVGSYRNTENLEHPLKDILFRPSWYSLLSHVLFNSQKFTQQYNNRTSRSMVHVVTGSPGIGKSALRFPAITLALSLGVKAVCTAKANEYPLRFVRKAREEKHQSASTPPSEQSLKQTPTKAQPHVDAVMNTPLADDDSSPKEPNELSPNKDNDPYNPLNGTVFSPPRDLPNCQAQARPSLDTEAPNALNPAAPAPAANGPTMRVAHVNKPPRDAPITPTTYTYEVLLYENKASTPPQINLSSENKNAKGKVVEGYANTVFKDDKVSWDDAKCIKLGVVEVPSIHHFPHFLRLFVDRLDRVCNPLEKTTWHIVDEYVSLSSALLLLFR
ncbi:hypothetical protein BLNAU_7756 [Blattamonas nauphoetae]|uniref:Uncharacterized protein n=1 Tax=Blattamonas nauphoetae TaxID=2049346 RepID=A0ABQ9Y0W2_9EUKA|nr:hypothetical protein BLNAU_7756 [Blattamonas nauphoetae]